MFICFFPFLLPMFSVTFLYSLIDNNCVSGCQQGLYLKKELLQCEGCQSDCRACTGPSQGECPQCAKKVHEWRCVPTCGEGYYHDDRLGLPFRVCLRCEDNCLSCDSSGRNCSRCKEGFYLLSGSCIASDRCHNGDEMFCEMVKSNKLCERKPFIQFCCRTCLLAG